MNNNDKMFLLLTIFLFQNAKLILFSLSPNIFGTFLKKTQKNGPHYHSEPRFLNS